MRDVALGGPHQLVYRINSVASAPSSSPLRTPGSQERSDPGVRAPQGEVAAVRKASLVLSSTHDNAGAGDDGSDVHGRKEKGRAREGPPAGVVDVGGDESDGPSRVVEIGP